MKTKMWNRTEFFGVQISTKSKKSSSLHALVLWPYNTKKHWIKSNRKVRKEHTAPNVFVIRCSSLAAHSQCGAICVRSAFRHFKQLRTNSIKKGWEWKKNKHQNKANSNRLCVFCAAFVHRSQLICCLNVNTFHLEFYNFFSLKILFCMWKCVPAFGLCGIRWEMNVFQLESVKTSPTDTGITLNGTIRTSFVKHSLFSCWKLNFKLE